MEITTNTAVFISGLIIGYGSHKLACIAYDKWITARYHRAIHHLKKATHIEKI